MIAGIRPIDRVKSETAERRSSSQAALAYAVHLSAASNPNPDHSFDVRELREAVAQSARRGKTSTVRASAARTSLSRIRPLPARVGCAAPSHAFDHDQRRATLGLLDEPQLNAWGTRDLRIVIRSLDRAHRCRSTDT